MLGPVALDELDLLRAGPDDAHLTSQDVDQLRQLVQAEATQEPTRLRDAGISPQLEHRLGQVLQHHDVGERRFGVGHHGA